MLRRYPSESMLPLYRKFSVGTSGHTRRSDDDFRAWKHWCDARASPRRLRRCLTTKHRPFPRCERADELHHRPSRTPPVPTRRCREWPECNSSWKSTTHMVVTTVITISDINQCFHCRPNVLLFEKYSKLWKFQYFWWISVGAVREGQEFLFKSYYVQDSSHLSAKTESGSTDVNSFSRDHHPGYSGHDQFSYCRAKNGIYTHFLG